VTSSAAGAPDPSTKQALLDRGFAMAGSSYDPNGSWWALGSALVASALEKRGLVRRVPDAQHRRVLRTSVTRRGLDVLDRCDASMDVIELDMLGDLPTEDVDLLRHTLAMCARSLEATRPPASPLP
jgi:hypothetical protein